MPFKVKLKPTIKESTQTNDGLDTDDPPVKRFDGKKAQPGIYDGKPEAIDFIAPSVVKELLPTDLSDGVVISEYMLEVGGTSTLKRYYRSFFAEILSGNTWGGMLDDLSRGNFGGWGYRHSHSCSPSFHRH